MKLEKSSEKLDKYYGRLKKGKAREIKPSHVEKIIRKLKDKKLSLLEDVAETDKEEKTARLELKLDIVKEQIERAEWLLREIDGK